MTKYSFYDVTRIKNINLYIVLIVDTLINTPSTSDKNFKTILMPKVILVNFLSLKSCSYLTFLT